MALGNTVVAPTYILVKKEGRERTSNDGLTPQGWRSNEYSSSTNVAQPGSILGFATIYWLSLYCLFCSETFSAGDSVFPSPLRPNLIS